MTENNWTLAWTRAAREGVSLCRGKEMHVYPHLSKQDRADLLGLARLVGAGHGHVSCWFETVVRVRI